MCSFMQCILLQFKLYRRNVPFSSSSTVPGMGERHPSGTRNDPLLSILFPSCFAEFHLRKIAQKHTRVEHYHDGELCDRLYHILTFPRRTGVFENDEHSRFRIHVRGTSSDGQTTQSVPISAHYFLFNLSVCFDSTNQTKALQSPFNIMGNGDLTVGHSHPSTSPVRYRNRVCFGMDHLEICLSQA